MCVLFGIKSFHRHFFYIYIFTYQLSPVLGKVLLLTLFVFPCYCSNTLLLRTSMWHLEWTGTRSTDYRCGSKLTWRRKPTCSEESTTACLSLATWSYFSHIILSHYISTIRCSSCTLLIDLSRKLLNSYSDKSEKKKTQLLFFFVLW